MHQGSEANEHLRVHMVRVDICQRDVRVAKCHLLSHWVQEACQCILARTVEIELAAGHVACDRSKRHDLEPMWLSSFDTLLFQEEWNRLNDWREVCVHSLVNIVHANLSDAFADCDRCIIDEDVDFTVLLNHSWPRLVHLVLLGHVNFVKIDFLKLFASFFAQLAFETFESFIWSAQYDEFNLACIEIASEALSEELADTCGRSSYEDVCFIVCIELLWLRNILFVREPKALVKNDG